MNRSTFLFSVVLSLVAGCSAREGSATAPVTGAVTYQNAPVEGATVVFAPTAGGKPATGVTDAQGRYVLSTFAVKDGAVPGEYKVSVTKTQMEGPTMSDEERNRFLQEHPGAIPPAPVSKNLLPARYLSPQSSDLTVTVTNGDNDIPLALKD
jgi:hypothetical protein